MSYTQVALISRNEVPELRCPLPAAKKNPRGAEAERHSLGWARQMGLLPEGKPALEALKAAKSAWFAANPMPRASEADLFLASDWALWLFVHDDFVEAVDCVEGARRLAARHARFEAILAGDRARDDDPATARALEDLRDRVRARAPRYWFERFLDVARRQLQGHEWEAANRLHGRVPSLAAYEKMRPCVYWPCVVLAIIASDVKPDAGFLRHAYVQTLTGMALNQIVWVNDVIGINHEIEERSPHNLALVLAEEHGLSVREALARAAAMTNAEMQAFLDLERELPSFGDEDPDVAIYLRTLRDWMRGHLDWYRETARYPFGTS